MHFAVVSSSFADVLEENYFNFTIAFAASKKIRVSKTDQRNIPTSFKIMCASMWVSCRSVDVFLSFIII